MTKKLVYDTTDADSIAASDKVGASLIAAGLDLTTTLVGSNQALDVNVVNSFMVDLDGVYTLVTNLLPDSVGVIAHTRAASPAITDQVERTTSAAASSDSVVAANVHGLDVNSFGMVYNGTTWDRLKGTSGAVNIADGGNVISVDDAGGSLTVDGTVAVSSVAGTVTVAGTVAVSSVSGTVTVSDAALANTALDNAAVSIADTATQVVASALSARKYLFLYNNDKYTAYIGKQSGLSTANGFPIQPGVYAEYRFGAAIDLYGICATGKSADVRLLQAS